MSLFHNTSSLHNHYLDCCTLDVGETIERDCLSVLHKLHDQVNGLQLVQVVVQPLARLFNPASLAALVANVPSFSSSVSSVANSNKTNTSNTTAITPSSQNSPSGVPQSGHDFDSTFTTTTSSVAPSSHGGQSRSQSVSNPHNSSLLSTTSTYMMSPDTAQALIARLDTDRDVNWLMEIIGYGLSMPFSLVGEQDSVKDCCTIYCEWLASALLPYNDLNEDSKYQQVSKLVPVPIRRDPNRYARKMLSHLYNVFLPRQSIVSAASNRRDQNDANLTAVSRQAVLCHRVLRTIENIAHNQANLMDNQTWDHLLALLLTVNDKLLSGPTEPDDIGTQLHDRTLGVLFELMLLASARSVPTPGLWKTFHEMSLNWRHRPALVDHWRRITLSLTERIVTMPAALARSNSRPDEDTITTDSDNPELAVPNTIQTVITSMNYENLSQVWYRFLTLIGNPIELSDPNIISKTEEFYHSAYASNNVLDPRQHPCLNVLPQIFMNSMLGLRDFIDAFIGTYQRSAIEERTIGELSTPDRNSHNQSARGSIVSLTNNSSGSPFILTQSGQSSQQLPSPNHQSQPQAVTPTQTRKTVIKSIAMKSAKVIPFTSSAGSQPNTLSPSLDSAYTCEHTKSGSVSGSTRSQQQFMPRPSLTSLSSRSSQPQHQPQFRFSADRPKCNSILHIFGDWLFSAALIGSDLSQEVTNDENASEGTISIGSSTATEVSGFRSHSPSLSTKQQPTQKSTVPQKSSSRQSSHSTRPQDNASFNMSPSEKVTLDPHLSAESFESGQAEAMAILCKIFSSKTSAEEVSPTYLSRFYLCLQHCLSFGTGQDQRSPNGPPSAIKRQLLASVLINSTTLLQKDLDGINLLIPSFIKAIEFVFECSERDVPIQPPPRQHNRTGSIRPATTQALNCVTNYDLRRACILTLLNLLAYPFHFQNLAIRNCLNESSPTTTFGSLRTRLLKLLFVALQTESDPTNMQILFGGLSLTIHDLASNAGKMTSSGRNEGSKSHRKLDSSASINNDGVHNSLETSNSHQDETTSQSSFVFDSSGGFLVKSLHVTCHLLINIWKHDTQVSLAALELLTTIARVSAAPNFGELFNSALAASNINNNNSIHNDQIEMRNEYKQTTKWICDYICNQCSRPPPAHSRDMHSTIVAAYQCLSVWFYSHPYLLNDESCVNTMMEVVELGISGQKSKVTTVNPATGSTTFTTMVKSDKTMKPSSMRVREAAESLLNTCMVKSRPLEDFTGQMSTFGSDLNELTVAEIFGGLHHKSNARQSQDAEVRKAEAYKLFRYFSDEDSIILGLLEGENDHLMKDSVVCLLRTPFGKNCWKFKFNYYTDKSKDKIIANKTLGLIKRPFQITATTPTSDNRIFPFPGSQNKSIYFNNSAKYFPQSVEISPPNELDQLVTSLEDYVSGRTTREPRLKNDLDLIGKIFSHQVLAEQKVMSESSIRVRRIDCEEPQPSTDLEAARIIANHLGLKTSLSSLVNGDKISASFIHDLDSLDQQSAMKTYDSIGIFYVRRNRTTAKEILESVRERQNISLTFFDWAPSDCSSQPAAMARETSIIICWLECSDDMHEVPCDTLLAISESGRQQLGEDDLARCSDNSASMNNRLPKSRDNARYFISPLKNGLYRVNVTTSLGRQWLALPLVDGMTVSKGILSGLIRESVLNICRRRRLDADSYQPPHVKRRLKLQEICNNYKISSRYESTEFYNNLFMSKAS